MRINGISIEKIYEKKEELQRKILDLIQEFEKETGLTVAWVDLIHGYDIGGESGTIHVEVEITL